MLAGDQDGLAQHFARSVPPIAQWDGIAVRADDPLLLEDAVGWLRVRTVQEVPAGDHTVFVGDVLDVMLGRAAPPLVYFASGYRSL
jgi:flavin reductase (DIM6/NTAB) family NADH-FMN oxidoreductase RutF